MVRVGVYFAFSNNNTDDYYRGGQHIFWWAAACLMHLTALSSMTYVAFGAGDGLIVAGIFAAAQSTVSTSMHLLATTPITDFMRPFNACKTGNQTIV